MEKTSALYLPGVNRENSLKSELGNDLTVGLWNSLGFFGDARIGLLPLQYSSFVLETVQPNLQRRRNRVTE